MGTATVLNGSAGENWAWGRSGVTEKDADGKEFQVYKNTYNYGTNVSLSASIPLFTGFELPNQYALAKLNFKAAVADLNKAKDDIAIQVASAYLQVLLNQELRQVAINQTKLSKEQADRIARLQEVGKHLLRKWQKVWHVLPKISYMQPKLIIIIR